MTDTTLEWTRQQEGYIYGTGTADLIEKIKAALLAIPKVEGTTPPKEAAEAIYKVLREASEAEGQKPDIETCMNITGTEGRRMYRPSWESGPHDWAIQASFVVMDATGRLCEPHYGFDLCLYDVE